MSNSSLLKQCKLVYKELQQQLEGGTSHPSNEMKWIEWAFGITMQTWIRIEEVVNSYQFTDEQEKIGFYKTMKPHFIGQIEYFTLLYKSVLFEPDNCMKRNEYWVRELRNCQQFISGWNRYYEPSDVSTGIYLKQPNSGQPLIFGININYRNIKATSYSNLAGRIIALKKYMQYIKEKKL